MRLKSNLLAFNRGRISRLALARTDVERVALSAEVMTNWMPRLLGSMMLRPGLRYLGETNAFEGETRPATFIPFIYAVDDTAAVEITGEFMRVWVADAVVTRPAVASTITNGEFLAGLTGWTPADEPGATSSVVGGELSLAGTGVNEARVDQQVTVAIGDRNVEHALRISVIRGTLILSVGVSVGTGEYYDRVALTKGVHSLAFTPSGSFYIRLAANTIAPTRVDYCRIEPAGPMRIPTPWGSDDLHALRYAQSGDVIFVACAGHPPQRIERRGVPSWSLVDYLAVGPFLGVNLSPTTLTPSATKGAITLTASRPIFRAGHVGAQFRLETSGQTVSATLTGEVQFSEAIRVTGVTTSRTFAVTITGEFEAEVVLQRSIGAPGDWSVVATYSDPTSTSVNDGLHNQEVYYRLGIVSGGYTSGTAVVSLAYAGGASIGIARVTEYVSDTVVKADVENAFGKAEATTTWWESAWSGVQGFPTAVTFFDGRLWWAGNDRIDGSVSDDFANFDDEVEGDSGPILRSIGSGPVNTINWLLALPQLLVGTQGEERVAKASSFEEPLTPSAFSLKPISSIGGAAMPAVRIDASGIFVGRNNARVYELTYDAGSYNYTANDLTALIPELGEPDGFVRIAVQRFPDTRVHLVRANGTVAVLLFDRLERVTCWVDVETSGAVEDVFVLPGEVEDAVYYVVRRTVTGGEARYLERWATEAGATTAGHLLDSFVETASDGAGAVTGLPHLEGQVVTVAHVMGSDFVRNLGEFLVSGGQIANVGVRNANVVVGLPYTADYKSAKLATANAGAAPLTQRKRLDHVGFILADTHVDGLLFGQDFAHLDALPRIDAEGARTGEGVVRTTYSGDSVELDGTWTTDSRLCLRARSPYPCTVLAAVVSMAGHDK